MGAADVELRVAVTEVQQAVRGLDTVGQAMQGLGQQAVQASQEARDAFAQLDRSVTDVGDQIETAIHAAMRGVEIEISNGMHDAVSAIDRNADRIIEAMERAGQQAAAAMANAIGNSQPIPPTPAPHQQQQAEEFGAGLAKKAIGAFAAIFAVDQIKDLFSEAIEQEQTRANLGASLGLTPANTYELGKTTGEIYAQAFGESYEQVGATLTGSMASFQGLSPDEYKAITKKALSADQVFGIGADEYLSKAGTVLNSGLARDATQAQDLIVGGLQRVPAALRDTFLDSAEEYSQYFRALGFDGEQAFDALVAGAAKGQYGLDKTGDAMKEFVIRATDGSKNTINAYDAIGLNANDMANKILAGGDSAREATQATIDGLLNIEDPAKRAQTALLLFGTPLEDMNVADIPSFLSGLRGTTGALGDVEGAAQKLSDTVGDTAAARITSFWRTLKQNVVDFIGNEVIPRLEEAWSWLVEHLGPAFTAVGAWVRDDFVPWLKEAVAWYQRNKEWIDPLAVALATLFAAFQALMIIKSVTTAFAALNAVLAANPIILIISLIAALAAGLIYAYENSETFRKIVDDTWDAIQLVVKYAWENVIKPVLDALWIAINWVGEKAIWLWQNVIQPTWQWISDAISWAWTNVIEPVFRWFREKTEEVGQTLSDFWNNVVNPVWTWIGEKVSDVWNNIIQPIWTKLQEFIAGVGSFFTGIYQGVSDALTWTKQTITDIKEAITGFFDDVNKKAEEAASNAATQGVGGISTVAGTSDSNILGAGMGAVFGGNADGGLIAGHGGPREDKVGRWLSPGEFVVNATSTARHFPLIAAINADKGMADGGVVGQAGVDMMYRLFTGGTAPLLKQGESLAKSAQQWASMGALVAGLAGNAFGGVSGGGVEQWRPLALQALAAVGAYVGQNLLPFIGNMLLQITTESGGNPAAVNNYDINAQRGIPSGGLLQVIQPTFENALRGTPFEGLISRGRFDPWANMISSILYGLDRYGSLDRAYRGVAYDLGGPLLPGITMAVNKTQGVEEVLNPAERATWIRQVRATNAGSPGRSVNVQAGAIQINVQGNLDDPAEVEAALERAIRRILADAMERSM